MPAKQLLMSPVSCPTREHLEAALALHELRGNITRPQLATILSLWQPATYALEQRSAKSTAYVWVNGAPAYRVNNRAKLLKIATKE